MSFLDRIAHLWKDRPKPGELSMPELLAKGLVKTGKWVYHKPSKAVGILTAVHDFPEVRIMLTQADGTDLTEIEASLADIRLAYLKEIPKSRRPSAEAAARLGYHA